VGLGERIGSWPLLRQRGDALARGRAAQSPVQARLRPRTAEADGVVQSICPYCAVGCGQRIFVRDGQITQIEGEPDSPISRGRLCPKGAATKNMVQSRYRRDKVKYRPPHATEWEERSLDEAMDMIADRVIETRAASWEQRNGEGESLRRTLAIGSLGGATLDNEENYLLKKLFMGLGIVQVENQARI
jgi:formate dehydrogenase major subunit